MAGFIRYKLPVDRRGRRAGRVCNREPQRWNPPPTDCPIVVPPPTTHVGFLRAHEDTLRFTGTVLAVATTSFVCSIPAMEAEALKVGAAFLGLVWWSMLGLIAWWYARYRRLVAIALEPDELTTTEPDTSEVW